MSTNPPVSGDLAGLAEWQQARQALKDAANQDRLEARKVQPRTDEGTFDTVDSGSSGSSGFQFGQTGTAGDVSGYEQKEFSGDYSGSSGSSHITEDSSATEGPPDLGDGNPDPPVDDDYVSAGDPPADPPPAVANPPDRRDCRHCTSYTKFGLTCGNNGAHVADPSMPLCGGRFFKPLVAKS